MSEQELQLSLVDYLSCTHALKEASTRQCKALFQSLTRYEIAFAMQAFVIQSHRIQKTHARITDTTRISLFKKLKQHIVSPHTFDSGNASKPSKRKGKGS